MRLMLSSIGLCALMALSCAQSFTYQGFLKESGNPANGTYPMTFRLYSAPSGGSLIGTVGPVSVSVSNGLFTQVLNFGSVWDGSDRYLEIQVGSTVLSPRVKINPTPYANTATQINLFQSGISNADRMVITHSPSYPDWGLMYRDSDDSFHFLRGGFSQVSIDLVSGRLTAQAFQLPTGAAAGRVLTSDASGNASWQPLPTGASVWAVNGANIYNTNTGNVGIGTATLMTARLNVATDSTVDNATLRLHENAADFARLEFTNTNTARKWHIAGLIGSTQTGDRLNFWNSAAGDIMSIRGDGTVSVRVLEITGADLAEKFPITDTVEPGMVVEIDPDNPGHLRKAQGAYNKRVVGVVAGANGLSKGIILGNLEGGENHTPIAMSGRVWVYADATKRAIEPGDFLTTADKPGYAMAVDNLAQAQGAIIGKAMTRLEKGTTGMVLILVNLQ
ncbi:hypothetical protein HRbin15_02231 [bacterium HR15]|nr:hypothetical protein HRbin15_02231 [bacterium HR15]